MMYIAEHVIENVVDAEAEFIPNSNNMVDSYTMEDTVKHTDEEAKCIPCLLQH